MNKYKKVVKHTNSFAKDSTKDDKREAVDDKTEISEEEMVENRKREEQLAEYADSLNCWLGQGLITDCRPLGLQMIELGGAHGTAFRFCPLENAAINGTRVEHVQKFIKQLTETLSIVESTVAARKRFPDLKEQYPSLLLLPMQKWAGVGVVCYIPSIVKETKPEEWNDKQRQQVSHLNIELVHTLHSVDSAFSSGECVQYGVSCVKFGMLSDEKDLNDLVKLVAERGMEIEKSQQYMDSLAEMIRQGIETANEALKKENDARLMQEGVMRHIPLMSSLVNWLSPLDKESQNIKGRSFDLKTGQIQSTDVYYKHRLMSNSNVTSQEPHQKSALANSQVDESYNESAVKLVNGVNVNDTSLDKQSLKENA